MKEFKSSPSRLIRLFKQGRENWKKIALERQQKLRALEIKVRDLSQSREKWKQRAFETFRKKWAGFIAVSITPIDKSKNFRSLPIFKGSI